MREGKEMRMLDMNTMKFGGMSKWRESQRGLRAGDRGMRYPTGR